MAVMGRLHKTIDVDRYNRLPPDVRARFDVWLKANGFDEKRCVKLTLDEGYVTIERLATDENGGLILNDDGDEIVLTTERIVVKEPPSRDVFEVPE